MMTNVLMKVPIGLIRGLLLGVLTFGLASCELLDSLTSTSETSPTATTSPDAEAGSPQADTNGSTKASIGQNVTCETANYRGEITWDGEEPRITFGRKPNDTNLDAATPVSVLSNADGSTTYGYQGDLTVYIRAYPDGSCLLQALNNQGAITVEEFGRTGFTERVSVQATNSATNPAANPAANPSIAQLSNTQPSNSPGAEQPVAPLSNPANAAELPESIAPASNQANAAMTCPGTIKNSVDFTAYFAREAGFNRVVFRPRESKIAVVSNLSYNGKNDQGQDTWRGKANEVSDVTLIHLSATVPQPGNQISVDYDGLLGQATCQ